MYLHHQHFIPEKRLSEVLGDLFACQMATSTIAKKTKTFDTDLEPVITQLISKVKSAPLKHLDETGLRIGSKTQWLHVVSTKTETWYRVAAKRKDIESLAGREWLSMTIGNLTINLRELIMPHVMLIISGN